jgi:hypothetical protein
LQYDFSLLWFYSISLPDLFSFLLDWGSVAVAVVGGWVLVLQWWLMAVNQVWFLLDFIFFHRVFFFLGFSIDLREVIECG